MPFLPPRDLTEEVWDKTGYLKSLKEEGTVEAANRLENRRICLSRHPVRPNGAGGDSEQDPDYLAQTQGQGRSSLYATDPIFN